MKTYAWCGLKAGYTIYCYIQYNVYLVFCCLGILLLTSLILCGTTNRVYASDTSHEEFMFSLCSASDVDEGLEVRDAQGRIVRQPAAHTELENLFLSTLIILLYQTDIHSIAESQASLKKLLNFAELMISFPVKAVKIVTFAVLLPTIKKYLYRAAQAYHLKNPQIPIRTFPAFFLLVLSRKLSTVTLRL